MYLLSCYQDEVCLEEAVAGGRLQEDLLHGSKNNKKIEKKKEFIYIYTKHIHMRIKKEQPHLHIHALKYIHI